MAQKWPSMDWYIQAELQLTKLFVCKNGCLKIDTTQLRMPWCSAPICVYSISACTRSLWRSYNLNGSDQQGLWVLSVSNLLRCDAIACRRVMLGIFVYYRQWETRFDTDLFPQCSIELETHSSGTRSSQMESCLSNVLRPLGNSWRCQNMVGFYLNTA